MIRTATLLHETDVSVEVASIRSADVTHTLVLTDEFNKVQTKVHGTLHEMRMLAADIMRETKEAEQRDLEAQVGFKRGQVVTLAPAGRKHWVITHLMHSGPHVSAWLNAVEGGSVVSRHVMDLRAVATDGD